MTSPSTSSIWICLAALAVPTVAAAQAETSLPSTPPPTSQSAIQIPDPDLQLVQSEPEFTLSALPTTLRMPVGKFSFRMTHRFARPIASGSAGDFFADLFGFDSAARVGLEVRYGIRPGTEATVYRTNDRSIQFLGQHEFLRQDTSRPLTVHGLLAVEGANNFSEDFSGTLGAVISHQIAERGAFYAQPMIVLNTNPLDSDLTDNNHTLLLGLGARWRLGDRRVYVVVEAAPRLGGFDAGVDHISFAIERRAGGHMFQFNVSNSLGTTMRQVARGGSSNTDWYVGFNLTRKFF